LLDEDERRNVQLRSSKDIKESGWSRADLVLIDEAGSVLGGPARQFGHTIVDEAQDLSAMEFRMIARRTRGTSLTILGDLAQATSPAGQTSWDEVLAWLNVGDAAEIAELSLGYRVPASILEFANRLLPEAAPGVRAAESVRSGGEAPRVIRSEPGYLLQDVVDEVRDLLKTWHTIGIICPEETLESLAASLDATDINYGTLAHGGLSESVTLLPAVTAKGLEFDAVVVVEPSVINAEDQGPRRLYVSLTRAVQHLSLIHEGGLPPILATATEAQASRI
jgi:DNA helicase IV